MLHTGPCRLREGCLAWRILHLGLKTLAPRACAIGMRHSAQRRSESMDDTLGGTCTILPAVITTSDQDQPAMHVGLVQDSAGGLGRGATTCRAH